MLVSKFKYIDHSKADSWKPSEESRTLVNYLVSLKHKTKAQWTINAQASKEFKSSDERNNVVTYNLSNIFHDLIYDDAGSVLELFSSVKEQLLLENRDKAIELLTRLQVIFVLAKDVHSKTTMDHEIYSELQKKVTMCISSIELQESSKSQEHLEELSKVINELVSSRKELKSSGAKLVTIEYTGEKIGGIRLFKTK